MARDWGTGVGSVIKGGGASLAKLPRESGLRVWNRAATLTQADVRRNVGAPSVPGRPHVAREFFARTHGRAGASGARGRGRGLGRPRRSRGQALVNIGSVTRWIAAIAINGWMPTSARTLLRRLYARPEVLASADPACEIHLRPDELALTRAPALSARLDDLRCSDPWTGARLLGPMPLRRRPRRRRTRPRSSAPRLRAEPRWRHRHRADARHTARSGNVDSLAERAAKDRAWAYGRIMVDRAGSSPMAWRALLRRCPSRSLHGRRRPRSNAAARSDPGSWEEALGPTARASAASHRVVPTTPRRSRPSLGASWLRGRRPLYPATAVLARRRGLLPRHPRGGTRGLASSRKHRPLWAARQALVAERDREAGALSRTRRHHRRRAARPRVGADVDERPVSVALLSANASGTQFDSVVSWNPVRS